MYSKTSQELQMMSSVTVIVRSGGNFFFENCQRLSKSLKDIKFFKYCQICQTLAKLSTVPQNVMFQ